ncbi:FG-GAP repeat domain-containing protein [Streptomyces sp. NPDC056144]|uniref:FG-GAP repeat domain-containing protein n=1 Tax=unclassified Streptomyces TaxID=2593676 RepID=UPI0035E2CB5B
MRSSFFGRARGVTACTALALSAGMVLASPALAETKPRPVLTEPRLTDKSTPTLDMGQPSAEPGTARIAGAAAVARSRFDVSGDGRTDLIFRNRSGFTLVAPSSGSATVFNESERVIAYDLVPLGDQNGNGKPELLTLTQYGQLRLYTDVSSTAGSVSWTGNGWTAYNKVFSPGDINGDGKADLLARKYNGDLMYYRWTGGSAPFAAPVRIGTGWGGYDQLVGVGDNNGDGLGDIIGRRTNGQLYFHGSNPDAAIGFRPGKLVGSGWGVYNQLIAVDDRNGDGRGDLLGRDKDGALWAYSGAGNGTYTAKVKLGSDWRHVDQFAQSGGIPWTGKAGLYGRDTSGRLWWHRGRNDGRLDSRLSGGDDNWTGANFTHVAAMDTGPVGDVLEVFDGHLYNGSTGGDLGGGGGWGVYNSLTGPGDLTGDGKADLIARDRDGYLYLYKGNGLGTGLSARTRVGTGWGGYNKILGAGDFTGDGRADVVGRDRSGNLWLHKGTGNASAPFAGRVKIGYGYGAYSKLATPGDLTGDGKADLVAVNSSGTLYRYSGTGTSAAIGGRVQIGTGYQGYNFLN